MQEARRAPGLIAACALALLAGAARADDLALDQVTALLHAAGADRVWTFEQVHRKGAPDHVLIDALSDRVALGEYLCSSKFTELSVSVEKGAPAVEETDTRTLYAFDACERSGAEEFRSVRGAVDPARLQGDFGLILGAMQGALPAGDKVTFADNDLRGAFATLDSDEISDAAIDGQGHLMMCFDAGDGGRPIAARVVSPAEVSVGACIEEKK